MAVIVTPDKDKLPGNFPLRAVAFLMVLCIIALVFLVHGCLVRNRQAAQITTVQAMEPTAVAAMISCPACKHQFSEAEAAAVSAPNTRNCPKCNKQIPLSYFIRQQQRQNKK